MSLYTGLQLPADKKLGGIVVMSGHIIFSSFLSYAHGSQYNTNALSVGYLPAANTFRLTPGLESTRVLHCHGTADPMVNA